VKNNKNKQKASKGKSHENILDHYYHFAVYRNDYAVSYMLLSNGLLKLNSLYIHIDHRSEEV
jgi:hypothetical protein